MASTEVTSPPVNYPHLTVRDGVARIGDTRFKVKYLAAAHHFQGWNVEELLRQYPDLTPAEVHAALTYFYDHRDAILQELEDEIRLHKEMARNQPSREELLKRLEAKQGR